ncbi:glycerophosphodiester phosphodiesterase family protein [Halalkalibacterium ligniniphilum]|uniref:glycerophosphodiester phosphodiesterase family protein n=1 Tax=Halalkalibacterium ligniniphilum TaxID=1134413 RepID=UPI00034A4A36|nr:glycerophosphodiester phosphodiesterase family protein [Halalkalibacterium ligniniphilum]
MEKNWTQIIAHRGVSSDYPENTMVAFKAAESLGVDGIEFDVQLSKDHVPVIIHDLTLGRTTDGNGLVRNKTVIELKKLSTGRWFHRKFKRESIPTLEEVFQWAQGHDLRLNIELKGVAEDRTILLEKLLFLLERYKMNERVIVSSFDHVLVKMLLEAKPMIKTGIIVMAALFNPKPYLKAIGTTGYHVNYRSVLKEEVQILQNEGIHLRPYTVNQESALRRLFTWGVSGIFTDYPHKALMLRDEIQGLHNNRS